MDDQEALLARLAAVDPVLGRLDPGHLRPVLVLAALDHRHDRLSLARFGRCAAPQLVQERQRHCSGSAATARAARPRRSARRPRARRPGCAGHEAADLLVAEIGVEQRVEMLVARPPRPWPRRRTDSRPWPRSRTHPCSRAASRPRSISGSPPGRARRGRSPPSACARADARAGNGRCGRSPAGGRRAARTAATSPPSNW